ncbi:MAG: outer membrane beta-barrel protein [Candidatus Acidiferrales bacterium]
MRKFFGLVVLLISFALPAVAQNTPKLEVFGGYQYLHFDLSGGTLNMNGFDASATYNFNRWLGMTADVGGLYNSSTPNGGGPNGTTHIYNYMFGPTIYPFGHHRITMFVHGLAGDGHIHIYLPPSGGNPALTLTDTSFTYAAGGGFDATITRHIAVRLFQGDYEQTHFLQDDGFPAQKNIRIAAGIVFQLGR